MPETMKLDSLSHLVTFWNIHLQELVSRFLEAEGVHDRKIDRSSKIDEVGLGHISDPLLVRGCE